MILSLAIFCLSVGLAILKQNELLRLLPNSFCKKTLCISQAFIPQH